MTTDGPSSLNPIPFHPQTQRLAQAYGVRPTSAVPTPPTPEARPVEVPKPTLADKIAGKAAGPVERLVAGVVPGAITFEDGEAKATTEGLAFYRHPADQNAAATGVQAGRVLDVEG
ncbi:MAG: hypothetical protein AAGK04_03705 [Planctomycetota bacterium]